MGHAHSPASQNKKRLAIVFGLTLLYLVAEVVGGLWKGSLALLADAGHMLTDVAGLGLALFAIKFAESPASPERTYGYYCAEILTALTNAVVLIGISLYILVSGSTKNEMIDFRHFQYHPGEPHMVTITLHCRHCDSDELVRYGHTPNRKQRYLCHACGKPQPR